MPAKQQEPTETDFQDALEWHFKTEPFRFQLKALEIQIKDSVTIILDERYFFFFWIYFYLFLSKFLIYCKKQQQQQQKKTKN